MSVGYNSKMKAKETAGNIVGILNAGWLAGDVIKGNFFSVVMTFLLFGIFVVTWKIIKLPFKILLLPFKKSNNKEESEEAHEKWKEDFSNKMVVELAYDDFKTSKELLGYSIDQFVKNAKREEFGYSDNQLKMIKAYISQKEQTC